MRRLWRVPKRSDRHRLTILSGLRRKQWTREVNSTLAHLDFYAFAEQLPSSDLIALGRANHLTVNSFGEVSVSEDHLNARATPGYGRLSLDPPRSTGSGNAGLARVMMAAM